MLASSYEIGRRGYSYEKIVSTDREPEEKSRTVGELAFGADRAAMGEHDVLGDGEAQTGASGLAGASFIDAVETLEEAGQVLGGNAGTEIADEEFYGVRDGASAEHDASAGSTIFHGIVDQVGKDLMDGFAVCEYARQILNWRVISCWIEWLAESRPEAADEPLPLDSKAGES